MASIVWRDQRYSISRPPEAIAYGVESFGKTAKLFLVLRHKGEGPSAAVQRAEVRHPGVSFQRFDDGALFDGSSEFGVPVGERDELSFDMFVSDDGELTFSFDEKASCDAMNSMFMSDQEVLSALLSEQGVKDARQK